MQHRPQACVVVGRQHHALADDGLALLLVVVVFHDVEQPEDVGRSHLPDGLSVSSSIGRCQLRVAQTEDEEMLLRFVLGTPDIDTVLESDGVVFPARYRRTGCG